MKLPPSTMKGPAHTSELIVSVMLPSSSSVTSVLTISTLSTTMLLLPLADWLATMFNVTPGASSPDSLRIALHTRISGASISSATALPVLIATSEASAARTRYRLFILLTPAVFIGVFFRQLR